MSIKIILIWEMAQAAKQYYFSGQFWTKDKNGKPAPACFSYHAGKTGGDCRRKVPKPSKTPFYFYLHIMVFFCCRNCPRSCASSSKTSNELNFKNRLRLVIIFKCFYNPNQLMSILSGILSNCDVSGKDPAWRNTEINFC